MADFISTMTQQKALRDRAARQEAARQINQPGVTGEMTDMPDTLRSRLGGLIAEGLMKLGMSGRGAYDLGGRTTTVAEASPLGMLTGMEDVARARNPQEAALAAVTLLPGVGPEARAAENVGRDALAGIRAYHGSPHSFEKFDISKIGTGEGAQAYGHGLYFAEHEPVARGYRDALSSHEPTLEGQTFKTPTEYWGAFDKLENADWRQAKVLDEFSKKRGTTEDRLRELRDWYRDQPDMMAAIDHMEPRLGTKSSGSMYEVNINANPEHFLDWDKPLSEQPQSVKDALKAKMDKLQQRGDVMMPSYVEQYQKGTLTGPQVYSGIGGQAEQSTEALKQAGIPGIKYLDQGSRTAGEGSRNYVVFDPKIIEIVRKYGIAGALGAGLITQEMANQMQQQGGT